MEKSATNKKIETSEQTAQRYLKNYIRELELHFNLTDLKMAKILKNVAAEILPESNIKKFLNMLKLLH